MGVITDGYGCRVSDFTFVDLFAGIGGFHAALSAMGGECVQAVEIDQRSAAVYRRNWGIDPTGDIVELANDDVVSVSEHDVLCAGFPCQPFSKSGAQRGMDETRGTLYWNILRIIQVRRPAVVLLGTSGTSLVPVISTSGRSSLRHFEMRAIECRTRPPSSLLTFCALTWVVGLRSGSVSSSRPLASPTIRVSVVTRNRRCRTDLWLGGTRGLGRWKMICHSTQIAWPLGVS